MAIEEDLIDKVKKVKVLLLDVDGVLTDGRIIYDSGGRDLKFFNVHDGMGVYLLKKAGIPTLLITAKGSRAIKPRARDMGVDAIFENISPKTKALPKILKKYRIDKEEICFVADDLVDLGLLREVGLPIAVTNGCMEIKKAAIYITSKEGGKGAVREVAELILKTQGKWDGLIKTYDV